MGIDVNCDQAFRYGLYTGVVAMTIVHPALNWLWSKLKKWSSK